ncbi:MAG TPA: hypothetical protein VGL53_00220 [Bryobacteraceae bacterium]|jgi:hypothetical protein
MKPCTHNRTEFLWRRDGVDYIRCLDCEQVFEADDLEAAPVSDEEQEEEPLLATARRRR